MMRDTPKDPITVDVITRVSQPLKYGDIFKCAEGDIFMADNARLGHATAIVLTTADNDRRREYGEQYAIEPSTIKQPYTLIISLSDHFDD